MHKVSKTPTGSKVHTIRSYRESKALTNFKIQHKDLFKAIKMAIKSANISRDYFLDKHKEMFNNCRRAIEASDVGLTIANVYRMINAANKYYETKRDRYEPPISSLIAKLENELEQFATEESSETAKVIQKLKDDLSIILNMDKNTVEATADMLHCTKMAVPFIDPKVDHMSANEWMFVAVLQAYYEKHKVTALKKDSKGEVLNEKILNARVRDIILDYDEGIDAFVPIQEAIANQEIFKHDDILMNWFDYCQELIKSGTSTYKISAALAIMDQLKDFLIENSYYLAHLTVEGGEGCANSPRDAIVKALMKVYDYNTETKTFNITSLIASIDDKLNPLMTELHLSELIAHRRDIFQDDVIYEMLSEAIKKRQFWDRPDYILKFIAYSRFARNKYICDSSENNCRRLKAVIILLNHIKTTMPRDYDYVKSSSSTEVSESSEDTIEKRQADPATWLRETIETLYEYNPANAIYNLGKFNIDDSPKALSERVQSILYNYKTSQKSTKASGNSSNRLGISFFEAATEIANKSEGKKRSDKRYEEVEEPESDEFEEPGNTSRYNKEKPSSSSSSGCAIERYADSTNLIISSSSLDRQLGRLYPVSSGSSGETTASLTWTSNTEEEEKPTDDKHSLASLNSTQRRNSG